MSSLKLYFDISSPYSWVAFESLIKYERHLGVPMKFTPVHIGFILKAASNHGPMAIARKGEHMSKDLEMASRYWGFRIRMPSSFEESIVRRGTLKAQRLLTSIDIHEPESLRPTARELWSRLWLRDEPVHELENLREVCEKLHLPNYGRLLDSIETQPIKDRFKEATDEAIATGAFGLPWIVLKREGKEDVKLFGSDRLPIICRTRTHYCVKRGRTTANSGDLLGKDYVGNIKSSVNESKI